MLSGRQSRPAHLNVQYGQNAKRMSSKTIGRLAKEEENSLLIRETIVEYGSACQ